MGWEIAIILGGLIIIYIFSITTYPDVKIIEPGTIRKWATMTLYPYGRMDERTTTSVSIWTWGMLVLGKRKECFEQVVDAIYAWVNAQDDTTNCLHNGVDASMLKFTQMVEDKIKEPSVSSDYDYHILPETLARNEHVKPYDLIKELDKIFGGK